MDYSAIYDLNIHVILHITLRRHAQKSQSSHTGVHGAVQAIHLF